MKRLLTILILIFTLQTPSQADDIRDFQIEGMSIGDSLLDYLSEEKINKKKIHIQTKDIFINLEIFIHYFLISLNLKHTNLFKYI